MRLNVYSVFDVAAGAYARPFFMQSDAAAQRTFSDEVTNPESVIGAHPEDYSLFRVGYWDDNKGKLTGEAPECLSTALEALAQSRKVDKAAIHNLETELRENAVSNGT